MNKIKISCVQYHPIVKECLQVNAVKRYDKSSGINCDRFIKKCEQSQITFVNQWFWFFLHSLSHSIAKP